ncbi:MAG: group III truncated hemoglobin [Acidimicrobiales bacterium]
MSRPIDGDLDDPEKVAEMVRRFYADVAQDALLGPLFNDVAHTDWSAHLPKLTAFWCRALFSMPGYEGNPYRSHQDVHSQSPFTVAHFERWLELFVDIVDSGWEGPKVEQAKALARKVADVHCRNIVGETLDARSLTPGRVEA